MASSKKSRRKGSLQFGDGDRWEWRLEGAPTSIFTDLYYILMAASWGHLFAIFFGFYTMMVGGFALCYWPLLAGVHGAQPGSLLDAFFFSVHTFSTIGFGSMYPNTAPVHFLVYVESFLGMVFTAIGTGIVFSKFARPTAQVAFSRVAVVHQRKGEWVLLMRMFNLRYSVISNVHLQASVMIREMLEGGQRWVSNLELPLVRSQIPIFAMGWNAMHRIDEESPLWPLVQDGFPEDVFLGILLNFEGMDNTFLQTVQAIHVYRAHHIRINERYVDMLQRREGELQVVDYHNLHKTVPLHGQVVVEEEGPLEEPLEEEERVNETRS